MSQANPTPPSKGSGDAAASLVPPERTFIFPKETAAKLLQAACFLRPDDITGYWTPATADLVGIEAGLERFLASQHWMKRYEWRDYYRQVAGLQQPEGRTLFLSYFVMEVPPPPEKSADTKSESAGKTDRWQREPYWANDGGDTYFRVIYDPAKKEFVWFERNNPP